MSQIGPALPPGFLGGSESHSELDTGIIGPVLPGLSTKDPTKDFSKDKKEVVDEETVERSEVEILPTTEASGLETNLSSNSYGPPLPPNFMPGPMPLEEEEEKSEEDHNCVIGPMPCFTGSKVTLL